MAGVQWRARFGPPTPVRLAGAGNAARPWPTIRSAPLAFHPVISQGRVFIADQDRDFRIPHRYRPAGLGRWRGVDLP